MTELSEFSAAKAAKEQAPNLPLRRARETLLKLQNELRTGRMARDHLNRDWYEKNSREHNGLGTFKPVLVYGQGHDMTVHGEGKPHGK